MSLRGGNSSRRSNLLIVLEIASGEEQKRPRNDMIYLIPASSPKHHPQ